MNCVFGLSLEIAFFFFSPLSASFCLLLIIIFFFFFVVVTFPASFPNLLFFIQIPAEGAQLVVLTTKTWT